jgi:4-nitrophenyl phosphatase
VNWVLDLDGVVWLDDTPIPGAADAVARLRATEDEVVFVTNNSNPRLADYEAKLERHGIDGRGRVISSATAAAGLVGEGERVVVCAGPGVVEALEGRRAVIVDQGPADVVVVGFHREFDYDELDRASRGVREGARFVATNLDATYPVPSGLIPGAGALVAAVGTAAGSTPEVAGKPEQPTVELIRARFGTAGVVVGDRPSTDGALAAALDWPFALVLSGVTAAVAPPGGEAIPDPPPPFVGQDLGALAPALIAALGA